MDNLVKQRLMGALILLALAVVFWPIIFVSSPDEGDDTVTVMVPTPPPLDSTPLEEPDNLGLREGPVPVGRRDLPGNVTLPVDDSDFSDVEPAALPARADAIPDPSLAEARQTLSSPEMDEDGLPIAYSLQVATMADEERAEKLRQELVEAGYKGYVKRLRRSDRTLYRVLVGPKFTRSELEPVKVAVDQRWRVESMIIRYLP